MSTDQKVNNIDQLVVYDHITGKPFLVNPDTKAITPLEVGAQGAADPRGLMKLGTNKNSPIRKEIKNEAKRLYLQGLGGTALATRLNLDTNLVNNWIYGYNRKGGWKQERERYISQLKQENADAYVAVERKVLERLDDFLSSSESKIKNTQEMRAFADVVDKILRPQSGSKAAPTNVNILNQITPLTPAETRQIIASDPINVKVVKVIDAPNDDPPVDPIAGANSRA